MSSNASFTSNASVLSSASTELFDLCDAAISNRVTLPIPGLKEQKALEGLVPGDAADAKEDSQLGIRWKLEVAATPAIANTCDNLSQYPDGTGGTIPGMSPSSVSRNSSRIPSREITTTAHPFIEAMGMSPTSASPFARPSRLSSRNPSGEILEPTVHSVMAMSPSRKETPNRPRPRRHRSEEDEEDIVSSDSLASQEPLPNRRPTPWVAPPPEGPAAAREAAGEGDGGEAAGEGDGEYVTLEHLTPTMVSRIRHLLSLDDLQQVRPLQERPPPLSTSRSRGHPDPVARTRSVSDGDASQERFASSSAGVVSLSSLAIARAATGAQGGARDLSTARGASSSTCSERRLVGLQRQDESPWQQWQLALREHAQVHRTLLAETARANHLVNADTCERTPRKISNELAPDTEAARQVYAMLPEANAAAREHDWRARMHLTREMILATPPKAKCWHVDDGSRATDQLLRATAELSLRTDQARKLIEDHRRVANQILSSPSFSPRPLQRSPADGRLQIKGDWTSPPIACRMQAAGMRSPARLRGGHTAGAVIVNEGAVNVNETLIAPKGHRCVPAAPVALTRSSSSDQTRQLPVDVYLQPAAGELQHLLHSPTLGKQRRQATAIEERRDERRQRRCVSAGPRLRADTPGAALLHLRGAPRR